MHNKVVGTRTGAGAVDCHNEAGLWLKQRQCKAGRLVVQVQVVAMS